MKINHSIIAAVGLTFVLPAAVNAGTADPEIIIYRFPGVRDDVNVGVTTAFHCTNFSGFPETIRFVTRATTSTLMSNATMSIAHLETKTASTHPNAAYASDTNLATGVVNP